MSIKIAVADLISNSFFPVIAADELDYFSKDGLDVTIESLQPMSKLFGALSAGEVDFVAGGAHAALTAFPAWQGVKLVAAIAQGTSSLLVMRADLDAKRNDLSVVYGKRIAAAQGLDLTLRMLLEDAGINLQVEGVEVVPVPGANTPGFATGVGAAQALADGKVDGFWANAAAAELAVRRGVGTVVLDVRRGDGPPAAFHYNLTSFMTTDRMITTDHDTVSAAVRAIVATQRALQNDVSLAAEVGRKVFPAEEAGLIVDVVERDLPFYDATISETAIDGVKRLARRAGLLEGDVSYTDIVAIQFSHLWKGA